MQTNVMVALVALATLLLAGCATKPISATQAVSTPPERLLAFQTPIAGDSGTVVTIRDTGFVGGGCNMAVYIDGTLAARIAHGEMARFYVAPGDHIVGTGPTGRGTCAMGSDRLRKETGVHLDAGETKKFRLSINPNSGPAIEPTAF